MTWGDLDWDDTPNPRRRAANQAANQERQAEAKEKARIAREARRKANRRAFASRKRRATLSARSAEWRLAGRQTVEPSPPGSAERP